MTKINFEDVYELSPMQQGILFQTLYDPKGNPYLEQPVMTLRGELDPVRFRAAWQRVTAAHPILRTSFHWEGLEKPVQVVHFHAEVPVESHDWRGLSPQIQENRLKAFLQEDRKTSFDLTSPPMLRVALFRTAEDVHEFVLTFQHLIFDRWSRFLVLKDVFAHYAAPIDVEDQQPRPRPYGDYITWLQAQDRAQAEDFWRRELTGFTTPTALVGRGRPEAPSERRFEGASLSLSPAVSAQLRSFARRHRLTMNTLVQGAWAILAGRYSAEEDVLFGATVSGRPTSLAEADSMVGLFINALPVRIRVSEQDPILPWLQKIQTRLLELRQYEHSSLLDIQGWSEVPRGTPLFESLVVFENVAEDFSSLGRSAGLELVMIRPNEGGTNYPLTVFANPGPELSLQIVADGALFDHGAVSRMLGHLATLLEGMISDVERPLWSIPMLTAPERRQLLVEWNDTAAKYPAGYCLHELFEAQAELSPDAPAVRDASEELTYDALNRKANRLAHFLRRRGVAPGDAVGVCLERSAGSVVALLGVLKAGGAYVSLDPSYPDERLAFMLRDSGARILLSDSRSAPRNTLGSWEVHRLDDLAEMSAEQETNPERVVGWEDLAYIIYTSGSTGMPKGVEAVHRASINRFEWMWRTYPFVAGEVCCQKTALSFVDSVWEIFGPLLQGIPSVVLTEEAVRDPRVLVESLFRAAVTRIVLVPSLLRALLDSGLELAERLPLLKLWVCSGETLPLDLYRRFRLAMPHAVLINLYGSSEVSADVTCYDSRSLDPGNSVPIGRPISNNRIYILDEGRRPVPVGVPGELWIGGEGLARGYRNRPDMTAERFCPDPFSDAPGARLFKTGDRGRYLPDGQIEYLGRTDNQIKLRGHRIEIGEVEAALARHPQVAACAVAVRPEPSGGKRLVGYIVGRDRESLSVSQLRAFLGLSLPSYMVPSAFVTLKALPMTPNGKVDRRALPTPEQRGSEFQKGYAPPQDALEVQLVRIWEKVLRVQPVGRTDNFFDLGGHSLLAVRLFSQIEKVTGKQLPLVTLFQSPTVAQLAETLRETGWKSLWSSLVPIQPGGSKPPFYCVHAVGGNVLTYFDLARHLGPTQPVYGLQAQGLDGRQAPHSTIEEMAAYYVREVREFQPEGPYFLGGSSAGGRVAFEMAQQLHAQGQQVGLLALFDTRGPGYPRLMPGMTPRRFKVSRFIDKVDRHFGNFLVAEGFSEKLDYVLTKSRGIRGGLGKRRRKYWRKLQEVFPEILNPLPPALRRVERMSRRANGIYVPKPYPGRVTLFRATKQPAGIFPDPDLGWGQVAGDGVEVHEVPGYHGAIVQEPRIKVLAEQLSRCLEKAHAHGPRGRAATRKPAPAKRFSQSLRVS